MHIYMIYKVYYSAINSNVYKFEVKDYIQEDAKLAQRYARFYNLQIPEDLKGCMEYLVTKCYVELDEFSQPPLKKKKPKAVFIANDRFDPGAFIQVAPEQPVEDDDEPLLPVNNGGFILDEDGPPAAPPDLINQVEAADPAAIREDAINQLNNLYINLDVLRNQQNQF